MATLKIIQIAQAEIGYLEKKTNASLNDKTANAGYNNYTKYGAWYGMNGQPYCDMFVCWCAAQAGEADAVGRFAYCPSHVNFFKSKGQWFNRGAKTPQPGDVIFFGDADHVGLVESVGSGYVTTIEGNTNGGSTLIANGGGVCRKTYPLTSSYIMGYGRPAYKENSSDYTWGVDVSEWQKTNDWAKIKAAGAKFAIIRCGYREVEDSCFAANAKGALAQGLPIGVYHFSYAKSAAEAKAEAEFVLKTIKGYDITLPVFFDWEYDSDKKAQAAGVTVDKKLYNDMAVAFCETIVAGGYRAGVYYNLSYRNKFVDLARLKPYFVWYAQYASKTDIEDYDIWQWSSSGSVNGVGSTNVDVNYLKNERLLTKFGWHCDSQGRWWYEKLGGGYAKSEFVQYNGNFYYMDADGYMVHDKTVEYAGKTYVFDSEGKCTVMEPEEPEKPNTVEEEDEVRYQFLKDVDAKWYRPTLDRLIAKGYLQGKGGEGDDMILDMSEDAVRLLVILERAGVFGK